MSSQFEISGRCHCGNIHYHLISPIPKVELPLRTCDCSFCTRQGAVYTSHPQGKLQVQVVDGNTIQWYRYGTETAEVMLCTLCGVFPLITCEIDDQLFAVLNAHSINGLQIDRSRVANIDHLAHTPDETLQRRQENWIPEVEINVATAPRGIDPSFF